MVVRFTALGPKLTRFRFLLIASINTKISFSRATLTAIGQVLLVKLAVFVHEFVDEAFELDLLVFDLSIAETPVVEVVVFSIRVAWLRLGWLAQLSSGHH